MPPPGYEPFLRAICADPEDDTVRLVYADWLDENGDPDRAEFIRLQIESQRAGWSDASLQRYRDLRQANERNWRAELPAFQEIEWGDFSRGFAFSLRASVRFAFVHDCRAILSSAPITHLLLERISSTTGLSAILNAPEMQQIKRLSLGVDAGVSTLWQELTSGPHLTSLQELSVHPQRTDYRNPIRLPVLTVTEARLFVESSVLSRLRLINLRGPVRNAVADLLRARFTVVVS